MGATAGIMMAVGGGLKAIGTYQSAQAKSRAADYNRNISLQNAEISKQQTQADLISLRKKQYRAFGAIRAATGASGVSMEGSPLDVLENSVAEAELDAQRLKYAGELRARGYESDAALYGMESKAAKTAGYFGAASELLMAGGNYYAGTPVRV